MDHSFHPLSSFSGTGVGRMHQRKETKYFPWNRAWKCAVVLRCLNPKAHLCKLEHMCKLEYMCKLEHMCKFFGMSFRSLSITQFLNIWSLTPSSFSNPIPFLGRVGSGRHLKSTEAKHTRFSWLPFTLILILSFLLQWWRQEEQVTQTDAVNQLVLLW